MKFKKDITDNAPLPVELNPEQLKAYSQGWVRIANKSAGTLTKGQAVIPDTTAITVVAVVVAAIGAKTVAASLATEIGAFRLVCTNSVAALDAGNITVVGKDENGDAMTETFAVTADANGEWFTDSLWSEITSVTLPAALNATNATARIAITAIAVDAVKLPAATSDLTTVSGIIVSDSIADEAYGYMATKNGCIVEASLDRADQAPGDLLATSGAAAGNLAAPGTPAIGGIVAKLLDVNKAEEASTTLLRVQLLLDRIGLKDLLGEPVASPAGLPEKAQGGQMKFICLQKIENIEKDQIVDTADDFQKWAVEHYPNNFKPYEQAALKEQDAEPSEAIKPEPEKEPEKESKKPERGRPKKWQRR